MNTENTHSCSKRQWKKWSDLQRHVFNETYEIMKDNQCLFQHPGNDPVRDEYWKTTCWNAAWTAADSVNV